MLVSDRPRGLVGDGVLDVGDGNVIAEDRPRVRVRLLDGRANEADERRIRQGIEAVAGEALGHLACLFIHLAAQTLLAVVGFISRPRSFVENDLTTESLQSRSTHRPQKLLQT